MANAGEIIINNVLCLLSSAKADHTNESLIEIAYAFYSHEEIKAAKVELTNILHKDLVWRRDPDKKRKDMKDVMDFYEEILSSKTKANFVCNSYKKMPPIGMELIAPILVNLSEEVARINELLPKILDIKTEVLNSTDTIRQLRVDVTDIKANFSNAVNGLAAASSDIAEHDLTILDSLHSFRHSFGVGDKNANPGLEKVVLSPPNKGGLGIDHERKTTPKKMGNNKPRMHGPPLWDVD